MLKNSLVVEVF